MLSGAYLPRHEKISKIRSASEKIDLLKYLVRLAHEIKSINVKRYAELEKRLVEIGKMTGGWLRSLER